MIPALSHQCPALFPSSFPERPDTLPRTDHILDIVCRFWVVFTVCAWPGPRQAPWERISVGGAIDTVNRSPYTANCKRYRLALKGSHGRSSDRFGALRRPIRHGGDAPSLRG